MKRPLRNGDGRANDGHEYTKDGVDYLGIAPCDVHRADAMRNRATHGKRDVRKPRRRRS